MYAGGLRVALAAVPDRVGVRATRSLRSLGATMVIFSVTFSLFSTLHTLAVYNYMSCAAVSP